METRTMKNKSTLWEKVKYACLNTGDVLRSTNQKHIERYFTIFPEKIEIPYKESPEHTAVMSAALLNPIALNVLIDAGADLNKRGRGGRTALINSISYGDDYTNSFESAKLLLEGGADPYIQDNDGLNAFDHAIVPKYKALLNQYKDQNKPENSFALENESCVSITKSMDSLGYELTTIFDFENKTIVMTSSTAGQGPFPVQSFNNAASPEQLEKAHAFLLQKGGNNHGYKAKIL